MLSFIAILLAAHMSSAQLTNCYNYDIHEPSVMNPMFIKCNRKGDTIFLDGAIDAYLLDELTIFAETPIKKIILNSLGGEVKAAFEAAQWIHKNKIKTYVRANAVCMSACTLLFQAGEHRSAHVSAKFMYHTVRSGDTNLVSKIKECTETPTETCNQDLQNTIDSLQNSTDELFDLYYQYGIPNTFYQELVDKGEDPKWMERANLLKLTDWTMSAQETMSYNIVQELISDESTVF